MAKRIWSNRVKETTTTTGTGAVDLDGAATGFQSFVNSVGDSNECIYLITDDTDWEVGIGTVTNATPDTLSRDLVLESSNSDAKVSWSAGTKDVALVVAGEVVGSVVQSVETVTADPSPGITNNGSLYLCDTSSAGFTVTLPAVANVPDGYTITVTKTSASNTLTVDGNSSETIEGETTIVLVSLGESRTFVSDGTEWKNIGRSQRYTEAYLPASAFKPDSDDPCGNLTSANIGSVDLNYLPFSSTGTQRANAQLMSPPNWNGDDIETLYYWSSTAASGNTVWQTGLVITGNNEAISTGFDDSGTVTDAHTGSNKINISDAVSGSSLGFSALDNVIVQAARTPGSTADTLSATARLAGVRLRFRVV